MKVKHLLPGDFELWVSENRQPFERRFAELRLMNNHRNGQVLARYLRDNPDLELNLENIFAAVQAPGYKEYLEFIPAPPLPPAPINLGLTRKQIAKLTAAQIKEMVHNPKLGSPQEVMAEIDRILALPAESEPYKGDGEDHLYQIGGGVRLQGHSTEQNSGPTNEERRQHNLSLKLKEWDEASRKIDQISIQQPGSGKHNFAASENAKKIARQKLGARPS